MIVPAVVGVENIRSDTPRRRDWIRAVDDVRAVRNMKRSSCCAALVSAPPGASASASPSTATLTVANPDWAESAAVSAVAGSAPVSLLANRAARSFEPWLTTAASTTACTSMPPALGAAKYPIST